MSDGKKPSERIWQVFADYSTRLSAEKLGEVLDEFDVRLAKLEAARESDREDRLERNEREE